MAERQRLQAAFDHLTLAIGSYFDNGDATTIRVPMASLAVLFDSVGRYEAAATIAGFAFNPITDAWQPKFDAAIDHLREVLGDETYESISGEGGAMTTAEIVAYAYDQIDQVRAELSAIG